MRELLWLAYNALFSLVGIVAAGWLALGVLKRFLQPRPGKICRVFQVGLLGWLVNINIYLGFTSDILLALGLALIAVCIFFKGSWQERITIAVLFFSIVASANGFIDEFIRSDNTYLLMILSFTAGTIVFSRGKPLIRLAKALAGPAAVLLVFFALFTTDGPPPFWALHTLYVYTLYLFVNSMLPKREDEKLPPRLWALVDVMLAPPFASVLMTTIWGYWNYGFEDIRTGTAPELMILGLSVVSSLVAVVAVVVLTRQHKAVQAQSLLQARQQYYESLEESQQQIRILRHDMANHLQILSGLKGEDVSAYVQQLVGSPAMSGSRRFCENEVANTVLTVKSLQMEQDHVNGDIDVTLPESLPIAGVDICALFANVLDNAIEACRKLPEASRHIQLKARAEKALFVLRLENSYAGEIAEKDGKLMTTKPDAANHGLGLAGIRDIAQRYHGSAKVEHDGRAFTCTVTLPV